MDLSARRPTRPPMPSAIRFQRTLLAACIILAPLSISLYVLAWPENPSNVVVNNTQAYMVVTSQMAGPTGNTLHFVGAVAASFFLPLGYLGMSLLGMRRSPWLATICAALSLVGWIPWSGLIGIDLLAYDIAQMGPTPQLEALWIRFNGDPVMVTYLIVYVVGHLVSAVLIGIMLGRLRLIPIWAAWAFALSSPLNMAYFATHVVVARYAIRDLIFVFMLAGAIPAALAMLRGDDLATAGESTAPGSGQGHREERAA